MIMIMPLEKLLPTIFGPSLSFALNTLSISTHLEGTEMECAMPSVAGSETMVIVARSIVSKTVKPMVA